MQEYHDMDNKWKFERKLRKKRGLEWPCSSCRLHFPAHAFIDDERREGPNTGLTKQIAITEYCITPGHWRCCRACLGIRLDSLCANGADTINHNMIKCTRCEQDRPQQYFKESPTKCSACQLQEAYEFFACAECQRTTSLQDWNGHYNKDNNKICSYCTTDSAVLYCKLCNTQNTFNIAKSTEAPLVHTTSDFEKQEHVVFIVLKRMHNI